MPYILPSHRPAILAGGRIETVGELNFAITTQITRYMATNDLNYAMINDIMGALESAKCEFYRRVAVPLENEKCKINGDVFPVQFEGENNE